MKAILIAIGNSLRRDDGAAHRVLDLLGALPEVVTRDVIQLTPELAEEIAAAGTVVFLDADLNPGAVRLQPLHPGSAGPASLGHAIDPQVIVSLSKTLYGFSGSAWVCHIPGQDFSDGIGLSAATESNTILAANLLQNRL